MPTHNALFSPMDALRAAQPAAALLLLLLLRPFQKLLRQEEDPSASVQRPWRMAAASLVPIVGNGMYEVLGQGGKFVLMAALELLAACSIVFTLLPVFYAVFKLLTAVDIYVLAARVKAGKTVGKWEWFWS